MWESEGQEAKRLVLEGPVLGSEVDWSRTKDRTDENRSASPAPTGPVLVLLYSTGRRTGPRTGWDRSRTVQKERLR